MSGSGGGGGSSEGSSFDPDCGSISFNTDINSPDESVMEGLRAQEKLDVVLINNIVVVKRQGAGSILGSVNWSSLTKLIECLDSGFEYVAVVRDVKDGLITVHISAK